SDQKNIETPIVVVVQKCRSRSHRFQKIFARAVRSLMEEVNAALRRFINETRGHNGACARLQRLSAHRQTASDGGDRSQNTPNANPKPQRLFFFPFAHSV